MKKIKLTQGKYALVDNVDYKVLSKHKWHYGKYGNTGYAKKIIWNPVIRKSKIVRMHHFILPLKEGLMVDHINGDGIDNRRKNLRLVNKSQNMMNKNAPKNNKSGYKGVSWHKPLGKWRSYITVKDKQIHLGLFSSKEEAAAAWNKAAIKYHGSFAKLNSL